ncbi:hypothetical protein KJ918_03520, partial [Patescibacteria group bacterium]|nr:hypothetical protein [Patescibacteria group bacterium]
MKKLSKGLFLIFLMLAIAGAVYIIRREDSLDIREKAAGFDATVIVHSGSVGHDIKYGAHLNVHSDSSQFTVISDKNSDKHKSFVENFKKLGFSYHRIGFNVAEYDWTTEKNRDAIYDVLDFSDEVDSDPIFLMSVAGIIDPAREHKYMNPVGDEVTVRFPIGDLDDPAVYGIKDFVKEFTLDRKNAGKKYIKYYELGNEEWGWWDETEQRFLTPQEYIAAADQVSAAIEEVIQNDATLKSEVNVLGVSSRVLAEGYGGAAVPYGDGDFVIWGAKEYETSQNFYDYVTYHGYWHDRWAADMPEGESLFALDFHTAVDFVMYQDFFPAVIKFQRPAVTEWNLYCWTNPNAGRRHRNAQKFEHLFYVLGNQLKQFEYDVPFSIYHNYVPPTYTLSEQTNTERGGCNLLHLIEQNGSEDGISA